MRALDCQSFAGAFALGVVEAGFELAGKREHPGGFGVASVEANRTLLGGVTWRAQTSPGPEWEPDDVELLFGNPPCSAFSSLGSRRGSADPIISCMTDLVDLAARCGPAPLVIFESVANAYTRGLDLMRALRDRLEAAAGVPYDLHHVLHEGSRLGGPSIRKRYFWVASRLPFGVEYPRTESAPLADVLGDLEGLATDVRPQVYARPPTPWSERLRAAGGAVDGMVAVTDGEVERMERAARELRARGKPWLPGERLGYRAADLVEIFRPDELPPRYLRYAAGDRPMPSAFEPKRWRYDRPGTVLDGNTPRRALHPVEDRAITLREAYRLQAFPDDWRLAPVLDAAGRTAFAFPGKGVPVVAGRWIAEMARAALAGEPREGPHGRMARPGEFVWADPDVAAFRSLAAVAA